MSIHVEASLDRDGFNLGWDYFCFDLPMPFDSPEDLAIGYQAARERNVKRQEHDRYVRKWLQLRLGAFRRGRAVSDKVTPAYLKRIEEERCPVSLVKFTYATGNDTDWSVDRVNNNGAYARGNLMIVSARVNKAKWAYDFDGVCRRAAGSVPDESLTRPEWERLAVIMLGAYQYAEEVDKRPDKVLPCVAWLPPGVPRRFFMDLQNHLLEALDKSLRTRQEKRWLRDTKRLLKGEPSVAFNELTKRIERRTKKVNFPPDTWRNPGVWNAYTAFLRALVDEDRAVIFENFKRYARLQVDGESGGLGEWSRETDGYVPRSRRRAQLVGSVDGAAYGEADSAALVASEPCASEEYKRAALALGYLPAQAEESNFAEKHAETAAA